MFEPNVGDRIVIGNNEWSFTKHPALPGDDYVYAQEGRAGAVYQLRDQWGKSAALKVFKRKYRHPSLIDQADRLKQYAALPGLRACHRAILTPEWHEGLLRQYPDLHYAALMPWIEGRPWSEFVQNRQALTQGQSHALAAALLGVLARLGQQGVAHGDLSGSNLIVNGLDTNEARVELVDVEQLYAPALVRPENVPAGSSGYAHSTSDQRLWRPDMDRFSGAVLLAEILSWCDERVRAAADGEAAADGTIASGEAYFAEGEMQQDCERYRLLRAVLAERWGPGPAALLERAWFSATLDECPPFTAGQLSLQDLSTTTIHIPVAASASRKRAGAQDDTQAAAGTIFSRRRATLLVIVGILVLFGVGVVLLNIRPSGDGGEPIPTVQTNEAVEGAPIATAEIAPVVVTTPDAVEVAGDSDGDGLSDDQETQNYNTDAGNPDSDGDGLSDGQEAQNYSTDANDPDSDGDGLSDGQEVQNYNTDPNNPDTDNDGLSDGQETQNYSTSPNDQDSDGDGLQDREEVFTYRTDPNRIDTDGDGTGDGVEVEADRNPLRPD